MIVAPIIMFWRNNIKDSGVKDGRKANTNRA
jgi:hypothetical protein